MKKVNLTKLQELYVKADILWDKVPNPLKVPVYYALSSAMLLVIDGLTTGEMFTLEAWKNIGSVFIANELLAIQEYLRKNFGNIEALKEQYNKQMMGR
jgi:hypothetical protein